MDEDRRVLLERLLGQLTDRLLRKLFGPQWGTEQWTLYNAGVLQIPLWRLIPLWLHELARVGFTGGKDASLSDVPPVPGGVSVDVGGGRKVWIRPEAYRDEEGYPQAEVRERYSRTDGAIWAMLAVLEGGEGVAREGGLERTLREDYEAGRPMRVADEPLNPANERLLECAEAVALHFHPDLDTVLEDLDALPDPQRRKLTQKLEHERREIVVAYAKRLHAIAKATRELQEYSERGRLGRGGVEDPALCVRAAELRDLHHLSWPEVGRLLRRPRGGRDERKGGHQAAEEAGKKGREILDKALPEGWDEYIARHQRNADPG